MNIKTPDDFYLILAVIDKQIKDSGTGTKKLKSVRYLINCCLQHLEKNHTVSMSDLVLKLEDEQ